MQPAGRVWFSAESKRAGWVSALSNVALFALLGWSFRNTHSPLAAWFYLIYAMALGVVAVGVLNWRQWHGFRQSMAASFYAVLAVYKIIVVVVLPLVFLVFLSRGAAIAFLVLFYATVAILFCIFYFAATFLAAVLLACAGGAVLFGLLVVMRYAARIGQARSGGEELKPRPLASVSL